MPHDLIASATIAIDAERPDVWNVLLDPAAIKLYMFGTTVRTDWEEGSPITWEGEWEGKPYKDKGVILEVEQGQLLCYSHYSPRSGLVDRPENYHTVTIELEDEGEGTRVTLEQDGNATEEARQHSEQNWQTMLAGLKRYVEES